MHTRTRYLAKIISKKQRVFPLVGILGARQVGKSTLLRDLYGKQHSIPYFTLDRQEVLNEARLRPENFILANTADFTKPIIIDEAHKAAPLFDTLKVLADERRSRGIVLLTGSVDFALARGVRETLTGRIGICRLYPMTISELHGREFTLTWPQIAATKEIKSVPSSATATEISIWLERGGMPAIARLGEKSERDLLIEEWLQSVCHRDLLELKGANYDGPLAREILSRIARQPHISQSELATELGEDSRIIGKHLQGLEALFILYRVRPIKQRGGTGFDRFYLLDAAIATYLGANLETAYMTLVINEILAQHEYGNLGRAELYYLASRGTTKLDLVIKQGTQLTALVVSDRDKLSSYKIKSLKQIVTQKRFAQVTVFAPISEPLLIDRGIRMLPYNAIC